jgi:uncharacterized protein
MLGSNGAARLQRDMTSWLIKSLRALPPEISLEVHTDGFDMPGMQKILGADLPIRFQESGNIGQKMFAAFSDAFEEGFEHIVLIGSDCPFITTDIIRQAFIRLETDDCVLGPAYDGGYYLIGLKQPCPGIFDGISWGGGIVLEQSLSKAQTLGLSTVLLERLHDIDLPQDIVLWKNLLRHNKQGLSVIIPTLNEGDKIVETLEALKTAENIKVIVADGGSSDKTVELARLNGAKVISSAGGRAAQMNAGAASATGEYLLFLHADTILPQGFDDDIRYALADPRIIAGAFRLGFDSKGLSMRIVESGVYLRSRYLNLPYGDQGIFVRSADFQEAQGFPELPIMDDAVFVSRLKKKGRVVTLNKKVITSARRYESLGAFRTWIINQCVIIGFSSGAEPDVLAKMYRSHAGIAEWFRLVCTALFNRYKEKLRREKK